MIKKRFPNNNLSKQQNVVGGIQKFFMDFSWFDFLAKMVVLETWSEDSLVDQNNG